MTNQEIVLITGGNTGLGFETVRALYSSRKAYTIILAGRSPAKVDEAIKAAQAEFPSSHSKLFPLQVDVEHDESITKAFEQVQAMWGKLDILINNAGKPRHQSTRNGHRSI
jgi:NAD(P)-dependent dehydrogenase (short-subunit alcohol dehydrogenase family)